MSNLFPQPSSGTLRPPRFRPGEGVRAEFPEKCPVGAAGLPGLRGSLCSDRDAAVPASPSLSRSAAPSITVSRRTFCAAPSCRTPPSPAAPCRTLLCRTLLCRIPPRRAGALRVIRCRKVPFRNPVILCVFLLSE